MVKIVDADELFSKISETDIYKGVIKRILIQTPAAENVEQVVYCKDCIYFGDYCSYYVTEMNEKDYCSKGKRR